MFDGTGDYLAIPNSNDFNISANGSFTFRAWYYHISGSPEFIGTCPGTAATAGWIISVSSNKIYFCATTGTSSWDICEIASSALTWITNTWYHIEVSLNVGMLYLFRDGSLLTSSTMTSAISSSRALYIGYDGVQSATYLNGRISEMQFINGVAEHTANFTPPRRQLESDEHTKLLLHFNRNDTTFIDSSSSAHTITVYGDAKQLCSPCGSGVAYFDGTGDYLQLPSNVDFDFVSQDFMVAGWFNSSLVDSNCHTIIGGSDSSGYASFFIRIENNNKIYAGVRKKSIAAEVAIFSNSTISVNTWYYVVLTRVANILRLYLDGVQQGVDTTLDVAVENTQNNPCIGRMGAYTSPWYYQGYLSDIIIKKGISSNGSVPTTPFRPDPNTKLLLHMDGVGNAFYDSSDPPNDNGFPILPDGVTITPNGTFTTVKGKDGRDYWLWPNSTNSLVVSNHTIFNFGSYDFTMLLWFKTSKTDTTNVMTFVSRNSSSGFVNTSQGSWSILTPSATPGTPCFFWAQYSTSAPTLASSKTDCNDNKWHHLAIVRNGSSFTMYIDGDSVATATTSLSFIDTATPVYIGYDAYYTPRPMIGNIKDLMIFKQALTQDQIAAIMAETYIY